MDVDWKKRLLQASAARNIKLSQSDIEVIKNSEDDSPLARWSIQNLDTNSILTPDEFKIWQYLERKNPRVATFMQNSQPPISPPLTESDIEDAKTTLEASTRAIERHVSILEQQRSLLESYQEQKDTKSNGGSTFKQILRRKQDREIQQLKLMNAEALTTLESTISEAEEKIKKARKSVPSTVTEKLKTDDRTLESLEGFLHDNESKSTDASIASQQQRIDTLLTALRHAMTSSLRNRLDRIYLQGLNDDYEIENKYVPGAVKSAVDDTQVLQLQEDLQTLYAEIDDVAAMVIEHEHGKPLKTALQRLELEHASKKTNQNHQAHKQLVSLTDSLNDLASNYELLNSYRVLTHKMQQRLQEIRSDRNKTSGAMIQKFQRQQQQSRTHNTAATVTNETKAGPALTALLRHLNIDQYDQKMSSLKRRTTPEGISTTTNPLDVDQSLVSEAAAKVSSEIEGTLCNIIHTVETTAASSTAAAKMLYSPLLSSEYQDIPNLKANENKSEDQKEEGDAEWRRGRGQTAFHQEIATLKKLDANVSKSKEAVETLQLQLQKTQTRQQQQKQQQHHHHHHHRKTSTSGTGSISHNNHDNINHGNGDNDDASKVPKNNTIENADEARLIFVKDWERRQKQQQQQESRRGRFR